MKIFRVHKTEPTHESEGYEYFSNRADAEKCLRKHVKSHGNQMKIDLSDIEEKNIIIGKCEFLALLNQWASHPDNG